MNIRNPLLRRAVRALRRIWYRFITLKSSPERIAGGFALGVFIGLTPTFGIQMVLVSLAAMLLRVNLFTALLGVYITNWFTVVPIYLFNYRVGCYVLDLPATDVGQLKNLIAENAWFSLFTRGMRFLGILWLGSILVAIPLTLVSYFGGLVLVHQTRSLRSTRRLKRLEELLNNVEFDTGSAAPDSPDEDATDSEAAPEVQSSSDETG